MTSLGGKQTLRRFSTFAGFFFYEFSIDEMLKKDIMRLGN
jgi:hypothetical protein